MVQTMSMSDVSAEKVTLENMYAFLGYFHRTSEGRFELGFSTPSSMVWQSCEMSDAQLFALDQRLPKVMDAILSNPLADEMLDRTSKKQRLATADYLRLNFDYWRRGPGQYILDNVENIATLWTSLTMRGANKDIAVEWTSFSIATIADEVIFLKKRAKQFDCGPAIEMDAKYPGLSTAYMVATQLGLDTASTVKFCLQHVYQRKQADTKALPAGLTFENF